MQPRGARLLADHLRWTGGAASGGELGQRRGRGGTGGGSGVSGERGGGGTRWVVTHGLLALGFTLRFSLSGGRGVAWCVWRGAGAISLGRLLLVRVTSFIGRDLRISLLGCWVAATEPLGDGRQDMVFVVRRHSLT